MGDLCTAGAAYGSLSRRRPALRGRSYRRQALRCLDVLRHYRASRTPRDGARRLTSGRRDLVGANPGPRACSRGGELISSDDPSRRRPTWIRSTSRSSTSPPGVPPQRGSSRLSRSSCSNQPDCWDTSFGRKATRIKRRDSHEASRSGLGQLAGWNLRGWPRIDAGGRLRRPGGWPRVRPATR